MRCPSCGAVHSTEQCPESTTVAAALSATLEPPIHADETDQEHVMDGDRLEASATAKHASRLIEFPGASRASVPPWRKELSKRVREVQEKRAREELENQEVEQLQAAQAAPPQLELLPQTGLPAMNPIVAAALRRIERAHQSPTPQLSNPTARSAAAGVSGGALRDVQTNTQTNKSAVENAEFGIAVTRVANSWPKANTEAPPIPKAMAAVGPVPEGETLPISEPAPAPERQHNLVVVQSPVVVQTESLPHDTKSRPPQRVIADNDPALQYLDSVATTVVIPVVAETRAPVFSRFASGLVDLLVVAFLSLPVAALIELQNGNWHDPRVAGIMAGSAAVVMFVYLTVSTAMTGRTLGMRFFSLKAIDVKTGLIPTGQQSAGRALLYVVSLATLGIGFCYALVNSESNTFHDRLSRTAVVRV
jgi:uncharacterized RDD family membrane protein YckC